MNKMSKDRPQAQAAAGNDYLGGLENPCPSCGNGWLSKGDDRLVCVGDSRRKFPPCGAVYANPHEE